MYNCLRKYLKQKMLLPRRGLKKCIHAVSNFIALIPFRSIRKIKVNYSGFKFENFLPNIRKRYSYPIPHKTKIRTFYIVFVLRIRRKLKSVPRHFFCQGCSSLKCFSSKVRRTIVSSAVAVQFVVCSCSLQFVAFISGCRQLNIIMQFVALFN